MTFPAAFPVSDPVLSPIMPEVQAVGYGWAPDIQRKVVALPFHERDVYRQLGGSVFNPKFITHHPLRPVAEEVFGACAASDGIPPTIEWADQMIRDRLASFRPNVAEAILGEWALVKSADLSDAVIIKAKVAEWARIQASQQAVLQAAQLIERGAIQNGKGATILQLLESALAVGHLAEASLSLFTQPDEAIRILEEQLPRVATGFDELDARMSGGAEPGLHVVAGEPKLGKTSWLTQVAVNCARQGLVVYYASGEITLRPMIQRAVSAGTGLRKQDVYANPSKAWSYAARRVREGGDIILEYQPDFTPGWLASRVRRIEAQGRRIDVLIVDYIDLMTMDGAQFSELRHVQAQICKDLRKLAVAMNIPLWTAKAVNRGAVGKRIVTKADLAECFAVAYVADNIFALCATEDEWRHCVMMEGQEIERPRVRLFYAAGRESQDGVMIAGYERDNDRQRWVPIPGYLADFENQSRRVSGDKGGETRDA